MKVRVSRQQFNFKLIENRVTKTHIGFDYNFSNLISNSVLPLAKTALQTLQSRKRVRSNTMQMIRSVTWSSTNLLAKYIKHCNQTFIGWGRTVSRNRTRNCYRWKCNVAYLLMKIDGWKIVGKKNANDILG